jgi:hypothetical protein
MTTEVLEGTLQEKQEKEWQGNKYYDVKVEGTAARARGLMHEAFKPITIGSRVKCTIEKGEYNGRPFTAVRSVMVAQQAAPGQQSDKDRSIIRQTALKCAMEFSKTQAFADGLGDKKPLDVLLAIAESFESWVNRTSDEALPPEDEP